LQAVCPIHAEPGHNNYEVYWSKMQPSVLKHAGKSHIRRAYMIQCAEAMLKQGLNEIIADMVGAHLFGPCILFATYEFSMTRSMDKLPTAELNQKAYPPWRYRIRAMANNLLKDDLAFLREKRLDLGDDEAAKSIAEWVTHIEDDAANQNDRKNMETQRELPTKIVYDTIDSAIPHIVEWIQGDRLSSYSYSLKQNASQLSDLVKRFQMNLLPSESGTMQGRQRADFRSILNAGWLHKLSSIEAVNKGEREPENQNIADLLALKAIESSYVQETFDTVRKKQQ